MHHLIFDTCVWFDLAVDQFSLAPKLTRLINDNKIKIIVPELVNTEWKGCKTRIVNRFKKDIVEARREALNLKPFIAKELNNLMTHISSIDPVALAEEKANERILAIENILNSDKTVHLTISKASESLAVSYALQQKAPFRLKNSMADALIFFTAIEYVNNSKQGKSVFVTHNTTDFSDREFREQLDPDLQLLANENCLAYATNVGRVLNEIEAFLATDEEIEQGEIIIERARISDEVFDRIMANGGIGNLFEVQKKLEDLFANSGYGQRAEAQRRMAESMSIATLSPAMSEVHIKIAEALSPISEAQRKMAETMSIATLNPISDAQLRIAEAVNPLSEAHRKMALAANPLAEAYRQMSLTVNPLSEAHRKMTLAVNPLTEAHRHMAEQVSGIAIPKSLTSKKPSKLNKK